MWVKLQGSAALSPSPSDTGSIVYGTGSNLYEPSSISTMHQQPGLETEAVKRADRFDCRRVETRGHHSDVDDSNDEDDDENCSNVSSSTSSSNSSFEGS